MNLVLNCSTKADQSNKPGQKHTIVKLNAIQGEKSPNNEVLGTPHSVEVTIGNPTPESAAFFESGCEYDVTFTKREPAAS